MRYARYQITRKPRQVFKYPKLMLGKGADCPVKKWYKDHFYPYELEAAEDGRGGIQLSVPGGGGFDYLNYPAEALVGQILFHARVMAEKTAEETVKETVITVSFRGGDGGDAGQHRRSPGWMCCRRSLPSGARINARPSWMPRSWQV